MPNNFPKVPTQRTFGPSDVVILIVDATNTESPLTILDSNEAGVLDVQDAKATGHIRFIGGWFSADFDSILTG